MNKTAKRREESKRRLLPFIAAPKFYPPKTGKPYIININCSFVKFILDAISNYS
jgi:hypothetical protein